MKKLVIPVSALVILFSCIMLVMACDDDIGLGSDPVLTPENIFAGGEWEDVLIGSDNIPFSGRKISFTKNEFIFNDWSDNKNHGGIYYNNTYTGAYKLMLGDKGLNIIEFISDDPEISGKVHYDYAENDSYTSDGKLSRAAGSLYFIKYLNNGSWDNNYRISGLFLKTK